MAKTPAVKEPISDPLNILCSVGQPSKYTSDSCYAILEAAAKGAHVAGMILAAGARSRTTFYKWQEDHPEFKEAVEYAKLISQAYYEHPDVINSLPPTAWVTIMNNKFPDDYSRTGNPVQGTTNINFNTLNLTDDQKLNRIQGLLEKLKSAGKDIGGMLIEHQN